MTTHYVTGSALGDIDMELHDIAQYLLKALGEKGPIFDIAPPWANPDGDFKTTKDPDELLYRSKMVKDLAMRISGRTPMNWR